MEGWNWDTEQPDNWSDEEVFLYCLFLPGAVVLILLLLVGLMCH